MGSGFGINFSYLLNENCADISDWTDSDAGSGESTQATYGGKSTFRLYNGTATSGDYARRDIDFGNTPSIATVELSTYINTIGIRGADHFRLQLQTAGCNAIIDLASDGAFTTGDGSTFSEIGTNIVVQDTWQNWKFVFDFSAGDASATVDTYLNGSLIAENTDCSHTGTFTNGLVRLWIYGYTVSEVEAYADYVMVY